MTPLPDQLEICPRLLNGHPCRGVIYRRGLDGTLPYCYACGSEEPGVLYVRGPAEEGT